METVGYDLRPSSRWPINQALFRLLPALGASRGAAVRLIFRDAVVMLAAGLAIALPAVWSLGRFIENQLFGVRPMNGATIGAAIVLIAIVALAACVLPLRKATPVSPLEALRYE